MIKLTFLILSFFLSNNLCAQSAQEREVIRNLIADNFLSSKKLFIFENSTAYFGYKVEAAYKYIKEEEERIDLDSLVFVDYVLKNDSSAKLKGILDSSTIMRANFVNETVAHDMVFPGNGTDAIIRISRVGFNPDFTQALVYFSAASCAVCGSGYYCVYKLINNKWKLIKKVLAWIS